MLGCTIYQLRFNDWHGFHNLWLSQFHVLTYLVLSSQFLSSKNWVANRRIKLGYELWIFCNKEHLHVHSKLHQLYNSIFFPPKTTPETTHDVPRVFVVHPILSGHQIMKEDWQTCLTYSQDHVQTERSIKLIWHTWVRTQPSGREKPPPPPVPQHGDMMCSDAQHSSQTWRDLEVLGSLVMFLSTQWRWWPLSLSESNT
jgi:hypothetical protein